LKLTNILISRDKQWPFNIRDMLIAVLVDATMLVVDTVWIYIWYNDSNIF